MKIPRSLFDLPIPWRSVAVPAPVSGTWPPATSTSESADSRSLPRSGTEPTGSIVSAPSDKLPGVLIPWLGIGGVLMLQLVLWIVCNPVATGISRSTHAVSQTLSKAVPDSLRSIGDPAIGFLIDRLADFFTLDLRGATVGIAFLFAFVIPLLITSASAVLVHLGAMITGGAPGGWRRTYREVAFHRMLSGGAVLLVVLLSSLLPIDLGTRLNLLLLLLTSVRLACLVHCFVRMVRVHQLGATRTLWLGIPCLFLSACVGLALVAVPVFWFWAHSVLQAVI